MLPLAASNCLRHLLSLARRQNAINDGRELPAPEPTAGWSRRRLLKKLSLLAGAAVVPSAPPQLWAGDRPPRIVVLGAGLAGLNAAYQLKKCGIASSIYEARSRVGGRVLTVKDAFGAGSVTDLGGEFVNTNHEDILALADDFGIPLFDRLADGMASGLPVAGYLVEGQVVSEAVVAQAFRPLARRIGRDAGLLDRKPDTFYPRFDVLSAAAYLDANADAIPAPWVRALIEQTVRSEYGVEPDQASSLTLMYNLPTVDGQEIELLGGSDERYSVIGGSGALTNAVAASLGASVQTKRAATGIAMVGGVYRITFEQGPAVEADVLICALPLTVLRRMSLNLGLPPKFQRFIREVNLGVNEKVVVGFKSRFWRNQQRFAADFWATEEFAVGWDAGQRQGSRPGGVLTFLAGSTGAERALTGAVGVKAAEFVRALSRYYPEAWAAASFAAVRTGWLHDTRTGGAYTNFAPGQTTEFAEFSWYEDSSVLEDNQEVQFGNAYFIGEHTSSEFYGFMNGAAETGRLAAQSVLRQLGRH